MEKCALQNNIAMQKPVPFSGLAMWVVGCEAGASCIGV